MRTSWKGSRRRWAKDFLAALLAVALCLPGGLTASAESGHLLTMGGHDTYMVGTGLDTFSPNTAMTRAQAAVMLYRLVVDPPNPTASKFSDVKISSWYGKEVNALAQLGVLEGVGGGKFDPSGTLTRAQFVTMMCRCMGKTEGKATFADVSATHWARKYIAAAADAGWVNGTGHNRFEPNRGLKRCEATAIMNRVLGRSNDEGYAADSGLQKFADVPSKQWYFKDVTEAASPENTDFAAGQTVRVAAINGTALRSAADDSANTVLTLSLNTLVTVTDVSHTGWLGARTAGGVTGYVAESQVVLHAEAPKGGNGNSNGNGAVVSVGQTMRVTASTGLNLRSAPVNGGVITTLSYGAVVTVVDLANPQWPKVKTSTGTTGYASMDYLEVYNSAATGSASLSASAVSLMQYQTLRLDAAVDAGMGSMTWTSSNPAVAVVGYTVSYNDKEHGAMVYGRAPGQAVLTFSNPSGTVKAVCRVTVTAPEPVRYAYAQENAPTANKPFELVAVTEPTRASVTFRVGGQAYTTTNYTTEVRASQHGLGNNTVRVFRVTVTLGGAGTQTVQVTANESATVKKFDIYVHPEEPDATATSAAERRTSTEMLEVIANFEGSVAEIEDDQLARKNPTVGYGYVVPVNHTFYNNLTNSEMFGMLVDEVNNGGYATAVNNFRKNSNTRMSQAQFDALVSFAWNCGTGVLDKNTYDVPKILYNAVVPPADLVSGTKVYTGSLNVTSSALYASTSLGSSKLAVIPKDSSVNITGVQTIFNERKHEVWYRVQYGGSVGWVPGGLINLRGTVARDMAYADSTVLPNEFIQWSNAGGVRYAGLVYRRLAESKIFFFANYAEAMHSNANYQRNTYGFDFPASCAAYDKR